MIACPGCGTDEPSKPPVRTYDEIVQAGWHAFQTSEYGSALSEFRAAVALDSTRAEGYDGAAWSYSFLDSLDAAIAAFAMCLERDPSLVDPLVGLAAVYRDVPDFEAAVDFAEQALELDDAFVFEHRTSCDWRDIRLILAECHYAQGQFEDAYEEVRVLDATFHLDPGSDTYARDLLNKIEELVAVHGGVYH
jgi:tetratricopeptide (TPR) repeat protein